MRTNPETIPAVLDVLLIAVLCCLVLYVPLSRALGKGARTRALGRIWACLRDNGTAGRDGSD